MKHLLVSTLMLCALSAPSAAPALADEAGSAAVAAPSAGPQKGLRGWLRRCVDCDADRQRYRLRLDEHWEQADAALPVCVLVHGFNSSADQTRGLIELPRQQGAPCGEFTYPNDQSVRASAELLSKNLRQFSREHPDRRVALVTHSMGGLVARECIENDALDPGNVVRIVMVAPPTHGSSLARYAVGLDLWEHWIARSDGAAAWSRTRESIADGLSEAPADLTPGSPFLQRLNARPRRDGVEYTVLLGSAAQLSEEHRYLIHQTLLSWAEVTPGWEADTGAIDNALACMDELITGKGDGAVSIERGRLAGAADTLVLPFSHVGVAHGESDEVCRVIRDRVLRPVGPTPGSRGGPPPR